MMVKRSADNCMYEYEEVSRKMTDTDEADEMYLEFNSKDEVLQFVIELG